MAWSWSDFEKLKEWTLEVCRNPESAKVDGHRYRGGLYDPPVELGYPAQIYMIVPGLHGFTVSGAPTIINSPSFAIVINLN